jgi:hypothetical protein
VIVGAALALAVVVGLSWLVGEVGEPDGFGWELAAVFGTALGTTLLAIATGGLALLTAREVSATKELAELTRSDQLARERPVVILHNAIFLPDRENSTDGHIALNAFNAGLGPALRVRIEATYKDPKYQPEMQPALWPVIMAGSNAQFAIHPVRFPEMPPDGIDPDGFGVNGTYRDRSQSEEYPIIVEWRTDKEGAHGKFDP